MKKGKVQTNIYGMREVLVKKKKKKAFNKDVHISTWMFIHE